MLTDSRTDRRTGDKIRILITITYCSVNKFWYNPKQYLAVAGTVLLLIQFLEGARFTIQTNHEALRGILVRNSQACKKATVTIRAEIIVSIPSRNRKQAADAPCRRRTTRTNEMLQDDEISKLVVSTVDKNDNNYCEDDFDKTQICCTHED